MADDTCETVRIKDDKAPGGYVVINKEDFDEKTHVLLDAPAPNLALRGALPDDFPAFAALAAADIHTYGQARKVTDWTAVKGVGPANAAKIQSALAAKTDESDE